MFKKLLVLVSVVTIAAFACKKEEICSRNYQVENFSFRINSDNIGINTNERRNTETTIGSARNQFYFLPEKKYTLAQRSNAFSLDIIPSAYAKRCVEIETSLTTFDVNKTELSINKDLNLAIYGLPDFVLAGQNLLANQSLRSSLLKDIITNDYIHSGVEFPVTVSPEFLKPLNGQQIKFTLKLVTSVGIEMKSSVDVVIDVNA